MTSIISCLSWKAQLILLLLPVPRSIMMCCSVQAPARQRPANDHLHTWAKPCERALLRKKNMTVQGSNSSYMVLKSGTCARVDGAARARQRTLPSEGHSATLRGCLRARASVMSTT